MRAIDHGHRRLPSSLAIVAAILLISVTSSAQILPPMQVDHLTITNNELAGQFWRLAALRNAEGMRARVVTVDWIEANVPAGVDLPATIRAFIAAAHAEWGVSFVLLGGDASVVPVRFVHSNFYPPGGGTDIPADLYYAGLDGDWNADGDEIWGEPWISEADPGDDADLEADVALGRAPVHDVATAVRFIDGTLAADAGAGALVSDVLLMSEVLFPADWQPGEPISLDGANFAEEIRQYLMGVPFPPAVVRMYENAGGDPDIVPLTLAGAIDAMDSGEFGLVYHVGHGWFDNLSMGDADFTAAHAQALVNAPDYFVMFGNHGYIADFVQGGLATDLLTAPAGGAVAYVGMSVASFPVNTHRYTFAWVEEVFGTGPVRLGPALDAARARDLSSAALNTVDRWSVLSLTLLGDPALRLGAVPPYSDDLTAAPAAPRTRLLPAAPNPFNPATTLTFELVAAGPVRLEIFAVDGRRIRTLVDARRAAGRHQITWHGRDDHGRTMASGVYLARLSHTGGEISRRLVLVR